MLARWPIRNKLLVGIGLLLIMVGTLSISGFCGAYAYRGLVKSLRARAEDELPLATKLAVQVSELRTQIVLPAGDEEGSGGFGQFRFLNENALPGLDEIKTTFLDYQELLKANDEDDPLGNSAEEQAIVREIQASLKRIDVILLNPDWATNRTQFVQLTSELQTLQLFTVEMPSHLHRRLKDLTSEVRTRYHSLIAANWAGTLSAIALLALIIQLFYRWVFRPLRVLVKGSRHVAAGDFNYRIQLHSQDEMAELADAMNDMTTRFQAIRDDLDRQVQLRTKQVVRSEQLASVGFLAAGVAHEINNPLASIAMCAESLEGRLQELCLPDDATGAGEENPLAGQLQVMERYLRMIQTEAFRCKGITEKLLDFSRMGDVQHQPTDLRELVSSVIEMVQHLGKYQDKEIVFAAGKDVAESRSAAEQEPVIALANPAEIKQVVLNLITNALDSLESGGTLRIELQRVGDRAELVFVDNGCGMTAEVLSHLFEPFFTRKRGGQGTGLGLSIVYRIIADHGGQIEAESEGPGRGSRFRVTLPLAAQNKERHHRYQAA